jgi:hypothetical protein
MYLVLSAFNSSPICLLATTKASAFSFTVCTLPPKKKTEALVVASKESGLEVNANKTKNMVTSQGKNAE